MHKWISYFLIAVTLLFSPVLLADEGDHATLPITVTVSDRSDAALQTGLQTAFSQALLEMSNDIQITSQPAVKEAMTHVTQWVESYSYVNANSHAVSNHSPWSSADSATTQPSLSLQVVFYRDELEKLLQRAQGVTAHPDVTVTSDVSLYVSGVHDVSDYSQIVQALRANNVVKAVTVRNMDGAGVLLDVTVAGNTDDLAHDLSTDNQFSAMNDENKQQLVTADLYYHWIKLTAES